jgi:O-methyltransferase
MEPLKFILVEVGSFLSEGALGLLSSSVNYLGVGRWMKKNGFSTSNRVWERVELYEQVDSRVAGKKNILYLEFGVSHGRSMKTWYSLLKNESAVLHGFDTFEGLPQGGGKEWPEGMYSQGGNIPDISDPRVTFHKGLLEETLPHYSPPAHDSLIVSIDCDMYSSTIFVLNSLAPYLTPGTYLYFDEFSDYDHELRAFDEFLLATGKRCVLFGATKSYAQTVFQFI